MNLLIRRLTALAGASLISLVGTNWGFSAAAQAATVPGPIYKLASKPTVYVERNGKLHAIASATMFYDLGYQWNQLHTVQQLPDPIGSPVQLFKLAMNPEIYLYQQGVLHWIPSAQVFDAQGYQWDNVYDVTKLPAAIGSPVQQPSVLPQNAAVMTGFPYVPASGTKTFVVDALTHNGLLESTYSGTGSVKITQNPGNLSVYNGSAWVQSGSVPVHFTHGQGTIQVKAGTSAWETMTLQPLSQNNLGGSQQIESVPNTANQVGWRVFTPQGQAVNGKNPLYESSTAQQLLLEPVNAQGHVVPGTMADGVGVMIHPSFLNYCSVTRGGCSDDIGLHYMTGGAQSFTFTNPYPVSGAPIVFKVLPSAPTSADVTQISFGTSTLPVSQQVPLNASTVNGNTATSSLQTVGQIQANTSYDIQVELFYAKGEPLTDLSVLSHLAPLGIAPKVMNASQRSTASTLSSPTISNEHVTIAYRTGSASNVPDVLRLHEDTLGGEGGVGPPYNGDYLFLITNAF